MDEASNLWVVVLAGGDGRRVLGLTRDERGNPAPKQFCRLGGARTLVRGALDRARRLTREERIVVVVHEGHRAWWERELDDLEPEAILPQPANRGTAVGVLRAALEVFRRDPGATLMVLPSDHEFEDEEVLHRALRDLAAEARGTRLVLAGMEAEGPDAGYGWIVPGPATRAVQPVARFVEKPSCEVAAQLAAAGAMVSSFIFAAPVRALLALYASAQPDLLARFVDLARPAPAAPSASGYERLPAVDFSRDLLERSLAFLGVLSVPRCGWTDLGTPERLLRWQRDHGAALVSAV